jgi:hypothetical protein
MKKMKVVSLDEEEEKMVSSPPMRTPDKLSTKSSKFSRLVL